MRHSVLKEMVSGFFFLVPLYLVYSLVIQAHTSKQTETNLAKTLIQFLRKQLYSSVFSFCCVVNKLCFVPPGRCI